LLFLLQKKDYVTAIEYIQKAIKLGKQPTFYIFIVTAFLHVQTFSGNFFAQSKRTVKFQCTGKQEQQS